MEVEIKILFNKQEEIKIPAYIEILTDYGIQTIYQEAKPLKRLEGRYLHLKADKSKLDAFLDNQEDIYVSGFFNLSLAFSNPFKI